MLQATAIESIEELESLRLAWNRLWHETRGASFFQTLDWLQVYWRHFGDRQRLRVFVVRDEDQVVGILPLVVRVDSTRVGPVRVLTYPLHDWGTFFGPVGANPMATLATSFRHLRDMDRDWDLFDLRWVNSREVDQDRTPVALDAAGFPHRVGIWGTTGLLDFAGNWQQYLATRSGKFRSNLRRAELAAARAGELSFERYRPAGVCHGEGEPRWELFDECLALAERTWQGSSMTGTTISHPTVREYFCELFGVAARCGALDVNLLRLNGQLIAFTYNLHTNGSLSGLRLGYDPTLAALSPGRLVLARSVEDSLRRGDKRLDLGSETMSFKRPWMTSTLDSHRFTHYPLSSWRSQMLRMKHWLLPRHAVSSGKQVSPSQHSADV